MTPLLSLLVLSLPLALASPIRGLPAHPWVWFSDLSATLDSSNMTTFLSLLGNHSELIQPLLGAGEPVTVFAPTDSAFYSAGITNLTESEVSDVLAYHLATAQLTTPSFNTGGHSVIRSMLNSSSVVNLPGAVPQVVVLGAGGIAEPTEVVTPLANSSFGNVAVYIIPQVLTIPNNVTSTVTALNLSRFETALDNQSTPTVNQINSVSGVTVFAPSDDAINKVLPEPGNATTAQDDALFANHVVLGAAIYSTEVRNATNATTSGGEHLSFIANSTGIWVQAANLTAKITQADIITQNGVVHIIDTVLFQTGSNSSAASSAESVAAAAQSTLPSTGFVSAPFAIPTAAPPSSSRPTGSSSSRPLSTVVPIPGAGGINATFFTSFMIPVSTSTTVLTTASQPTPTVSVTTVTVLSSPAVVTSPRPIIH